MDARGMGGGREKAKENSGSDGSEGHNEVRCRYRKNLREKNLGRDLGLDVRPAANVKGGKRVECESGKET